LSLIIPASALKRKPAWSRSASYITQTTANYHPLWFETVEIYSTIFLNTCKWNDNCNILWLEKAVQNQENRHLCWQFLHL